MIGYISFPFNWITQHPKNLSVDWGGPTWVSAPNPGRGSVMGYKKMGVWPNPQLPAPRTALCWHRTPDTGHWISRKVSWVWWAPCGFRFACVTLWRQKERNDKLAGGFRIVSLRISQSHIWLCNSTSGLYVASITSGFFLHYRLRSTVWTKIWHVCSCQLGTVSVVL